MLRPQRLKTSLCSKNVWKSPILLIGTWPFRGKKFVPLGRLKFLLETYFCNFIYVSRSRPLTRKHTNVIFHSPLGDQR